MKIGVKALPGTEVYAILGDEYYKTKVQSVEVLEDGSVCYMIYDPDSESCASGYSDDEFYLTEAEAKKAVSEDG
jgi:hypothetical protein